MCKLLASKVLMIRFFLYQLLGMSMLLLPAHTAAQGCACTTPSPQQAIDQADLIFQGTVTAVETNWISGGWKFSFQPSQSWKKTTNNVYLVNTPWEKDCGYLFEKGKEYVVFVRRKFTPKTDSCMGNLPVEAASEVLQLLGSGKPPQRSPMYVQMVWMVSLLGGFGLAFVAFVVLRKKIRFNR